MSKCGTVYHCIGYNLTIRKLRASVVLDGCVITLSVADVRKTFKQVNVHKAAGPGGLPGRVL
jgi:hypothetical protein